MTETRVWQFCSYNAVSVLNVPLQGRTSNNTSQDMVCVFAPVRVCFTLLWTLQRVALRKSYLWRPDCGDWQSEASSTTNQRIFIPIEQWKCTNPKHFRVRTRRQPCLHASLDHHQLPFWPIHKGFAQNWIHTLGVRKLDSRSALQKFYCTAKQKALRKLTRN